MNMHKKLILIRLAQATIGLLIMLELIAKTANFTTMQTVALGLSLISAVIPLGLLPEIRLILNAVARRFREAKLIPKKLSALGVLTAKSLVLIKPVTYTNTSKMKFDGVVIGRRQYLPKDPELKELELVASAIKIIKAGVETGIVKATANLKYGDQKIVFISGPVDKILETTTDIWDHDHVRKLTAADRKYFINHSPKEQAKTGCYSVAVGYRLTGEKRFTLLGLISMSDPRAIALPELNKTETLQARQTIIHAIQTTLTTCSTQLALVIMSVFGLATYHLAPAITFMQIVALELLLCVPVAALAYEKNYQKLTKVKWRSPVAFGLLAAVVAYANYLLFFARHGLSPLYLDASLPIYHQAASLTLLTALLCSFSYLLFERADHHEQFFTDHLHSNDKLLQAFGASLTMLALIVYLPWLQAVFSTASLDIVDWASALVGACLYALIRLLQRHTRKHSRHAVLKLHHDSP